MPNDNINRAIKKGTGELEGESYEELTFEGYGPSGVAIIVEALTDNKNRTAAFVRSVFDKNGGNLGTPGCVSYMFARKGVIYIEKQDGMDEDAVMMDALDAGAEDMIVNEDNLRFVRTDGLPRSSGRHSEGRIRGCGFRPGIYSVDGSNGRPFGNEAAEQAD